MLRTRRPVVDVRMNPGDHAVTAHAIGKRSARGEAMRSAEPQTPSSDGD
jgi:hypothetical protein